MNKVFASLTVTALIPCLTQIPAQSQVAKWYTLGAGTTIPAMLDKWVDARKSKVGDEVVAQTTEPVREHGQVIIPKGSKIFGRVTEAKSRTTEDPNSVLGITFDHAVLKKGGELRLRVMIEAIAPDRTSTEPPPLLSGTTPTDNTGSMGPINRPSTMGPSSRRSERQLGCSYRPGSFQFQAEF
jgi:hypothetical protein